jgi:hypothetical protein
MIEMERAETVRNRACAKRGWTGQPQSRIVESRIVDYHRRVSADEADNVSGGA